MPDPIETMIATNTEVLRLWGKLPTAVDNRDVQAPEVLPMSPRIAQVRAEIAARVYETDDKIDIAVDGLLEDLQHRDLATDIARDVTAAQEEAEELGDRWDGLS